jgi:hypothetical protein
MAGRSYKRLLFYLSTPLCHCLNMVMSMKTCIKHDFEKTCLEPLPKFRPENYQRASTSAKSFPYIYLNRGQRSKVLTSEPFTWVSERVTYGYIRSSGKSINYLVSSAIWLTRTCCKIFSKPTLCRFLFRNVKNSKLV